MHNEKKLCMGVVYLTVFCYRLVTIYTNYQLVATRTTD